MSSVERFISHYFPDVRSVDTPSDVPAGDAVVRHIDDKRPQKRGFLRRLTEVADEPLVVMTCEEFIADYDERHKDDEPNEFVETVPATTTQQKVVGSGAVHSSLWDRAS